MKKALIIIDMLVNDMSGLYCSKKIIKNQVKLVEAFKKKKHKVILVGGNKDGKPSGNPTKPNPVMMRLWGDESKKKGKPLPAEQLRVIPELLNGPYDLYIKKREYSAFYKTNLESYLKKNNIKEVYLAGIYAGCCVYFTGADAAMRGIQPILVKDASASPSPESLKKNIDNFKTFMGPAINTKKVIEGL